MPFFAPHLHLAHASAVVVAEVPHCRIRTAERVGSDDQEWASSRRGCAGLAARTHLVALCGLVAAVAQHGGPALGEGVVGEVLHLPARRDAGECVRRQVQPDVAVDALGLAEGSELLARGEALGVRLGKDEIARVVVIIARPEELEKRLAVGVDRKLRNREEDATARVVCR